MTDDLVPGEVITAEGTVHLNEGRDTASVDVANTGDRPIQVGSHFHFFEVNAALEFDRRTAYGRRLNIPAGTARRFEPGDRTRVELVDIGGKRRTKGMNGLVDGTAERGVDAALERARTAGFADTGDESDRTGDDS